LQYEFQRGYAARMCTTQRPHFLSLTNVTETYSSNCQISERCCLDDPEYEEALVGYDDLRKVDECLSVYLSDPEDLEEQRKWIAEKTKRR
jgi:hypothetical protein